MIAFRSCLVLIAFESSSRTYDFCPISASRFLQNSSRTWILQIGFIVRLRTRLPPTYILYQRIGGISKGCLWCVLRSQYCAYATLVVLRTVYVYCRWIRSTDTVKMSDSMQHFPLIPFLFFTEKGSVSHATTTNFLSGLIF